LQSVDAAALPPPPVAAGPKPASALAIIAIVLAVLLAIAAAVVATLNWTGPPAQVAGYLIGSLLGAIGIPFLIAYLIAGRKKVRNPRTFAWVFCSVAFIFAGGNLVSNLGSIKPESGEEMAGRLMREAAGLQPARHSILPGRRKMEDALRAEFKKMVQANKDYSEKVNVMDTSAVKDLNSAESFVQPEVGDLALKQIHAVFDLDAGQEQELAHIIADLRHVLASTASSNSEREELEKGFDRGIQETMARRSNTVAAEKAWVDSLDDEYQFARAHQASMHEVNGEVVIQGHQIVLEFNRRVERQETLRKEFLRLQQGFSQFQAQRLKKAGLKPEDVGNK
jgi:hypothetical protein